MPRYGERADPLAGTPYRTLRRVGGGATAQVFEAERLADGKHFAVKILRAGVETATDAVARMRLEARTLTLLWHPNVVEIETIDETPTGRPYLVMEYLRGRTLYQELRRRGAFAVHDAIACVCDALRGLRAVHRLGIVHRDLKLENLFLCKQPDGTRIVKLVDFGFAKIPRTPRGRRRRALSTPQDRFVGTARYAAPEQVLEGEPLDHRADLYVIGLVLYALLTGREPYGDRGISRASGRHSQEIRHIVAV